MDIEKVIEIIKTIATVTGCCVSIITLSGLIIKPLRKRIFNWFINVTHKEQIIDLQKRVNNLEQINEKMQKLDERMTKIENNNKVLDDIRHTLEELNKRTFDNERDRLRGELFNCGNRCRRGLPLYADEFRYIQSVYKKYNEELHENSIGTDEYEFIKDYFESPFNKELINGK